MDEHKRFNPPDQLPHQGRWRPYYVRDAPVKVWDEELTFATGAGIGCGGGGRVTRRDN